MLAILLSTAVSLGCGSGSGAPRSPVVDTRREPTNHAEVAPGGLGFTASEQDPKGRHPPPDHPVIPPENFGKCLRSRVCGLEGLCSMAKSGDCMAANDDDCSGSDACHGGRCTARDGVCIAGSDEDCRGSWACKGWGRCSHDGDALCIATSQADCKASTRCAREGECQLSGDECVKAP